MKFPCKIHGCHFEGEFNEIIECGEFFKKMGLEDLDINKKRQIYDAFVMINPDELLSKYGYWTDAMMMHCTKLENMGKMLMYGKNYKTREAKAILHKRILLGPSKLLGRIWKSYYMMIGALSLRTPKIEDYQ